MKIRQSIRRFFRHEKSDDQQRLEIYYLMIQFIKGNIYFGGLCFALENVVWKLDHTYGTNLKTNIQFYPELMSRKPVEGDLFNMSWWFAPHLVEPRTKILTEAINELEFKLSNTKVSEETDI